MIHLLQENPIIVVVLFACSMVLMSVLTYKLAREKFVLKRTCAEKDKLFDQYVSVCNELEELRSNAVHRETEERRLSDENADLLRENNQLIKQNASLSALKKAFRALKSEKKQWSDNQIALMQLYESPNLMVIRQLLKAQVVSEDTVVPFRVPGTQQYYSPIKVMDLLFLFMKVEAPQSDMVELFAMANKKPEPVIITNHKEPSLSRLQAITEECE